MKHPISVSIKPAAAQCAELDKKIEHYRSLIARVTDQQANEALSQLREGQLEGAAVLTIASTTRAAGVS